MYIDSHCHLQFEQFNDDRASVIGNAKKAGVKKIIVPGVDTLSSNLAVSLAHQYPDVLFASIGFHPYEASHNPSVSFLKKLLTTPHVQPTIIAIGEIGLDYHLYKGEEAKGKSRNKHNYLKTNSG